MLCKLTYKINLRHNLLLNENGIYELKINLVFKIKISKPQRNAFRNAIRLCLEDLRILRFSVSRSDN